jgi:hypothetical protein
MTWKERSVMDERLQFVARRRADGGTLQGVRDLAQDRLQDLRPLEGMSRSRADRGMLASFPFRSHSVQPTRP